jgi:peptidoglycan L-alanyl-D-glutamate endopeptidase CwlK
MTYKLSKNSRARLQGIKPVLIEIIEAAIVNSPYDFGIPQDGGLRTAYRQNEMYAQGRTKAGKIITWVDGMKKRSRHQDGDAFDIYAFVEGKASWDIQHLTAIARHLQAVALTFGVELEWGGDWTKFSDFPHLQISRK